MFPMTKYTLLDLFAGCGGLSHGLSKAGFCSIAANEYQQVISESYAANHPESEVIQGDITAPEVFSKLKSFKGKIDMISGGPPCQGFSTIGSKEEKDPRNKLFYAMMELAAHVKPKAIFFENVSGFKRMYGGRAFDALLDELRKMDYKMPSAPQVLDAADFGAPQHRLRTVVIAFRKDIYSDFEFPDPTHGESSLLLKKKPKPFLTIEEAISDLPAIKSGEAAYEYLTGPANDFQKEMRIRASRELRYHDAPDHGEHLMRVMSFVKRGGSILDVPVNLRPKSYFANTYARLLPDAPAPTMTRNFGTPSSSRCIHPYINRGLTTREGARLQTFPDRYTLLGSRGERNLQVGNAVPPVLATAVGRAIAAALS
jgi:DNA (cytosine-5)-methyltransferase 1